MSRNYEDWLQAYLDYSSCTEAPRHMHFWSGVSAIAGALRRKVWIDQAYFKWYPNFYIVLVAPPGIVSKSTTMGIAMNLLRQVPEIDFGPDVVTWQSLVETFAGITKTFTLPDPKTGELLYYPMSAMTLESSEFGNLLNPQDREMVDLLVSLWDGKQGAFVKKTKTSGNDSIENPWINLIACTTPSWIDGNFPEYMIGGGFTSRTIFVYADKKAQLIAYPGKMVPSDLKEKEAKLVADLTEIATLAGEYQLTQEALAWGEAWYRRHYAKKPSTELDMTQFGGYIARKQVQMHKLAMVLAAGQSNDLWITADHLAIADSMISDLEPDLPFVFQRIGQNDNSSRMQRFVEYVHGFGKDGVSYEQAFRHVHALFPLLRDFEEMLAGCIKANYIELRKSGVTARLYPGGAALPQAAQRNAQGERIS